MSKNSSSRIHPYTGSEPYLFLCFSDADERKVRPLLERLYRRGCRIWYTLGRASDLQGQRLRSERLSHASLTVLFNTAAFSSDTDAKSELLSCQGNGCPIICIDTENAADALSLGLTDARHIVRPKNAAAAEEALLRTEGFSQELIGKPQAYRRKNPRLLLALLFITLTLLLAAGGYFYAKQRKQPAEEPPQDTVFFSEEMLEDAVRVALDGAVLTPESVSGITRLDLPALPERIADLALLPNLTELSVPQEAVLSDPDKTDSLLSQYKIILRGGEK